MNTNKPSIVFCHGIWADGSSFGKVIPPLQADGYEVMAGLSNDRGESHRRRVLAVPSKLSEVFFYV